MKKLIDEVVAEYKKVSWPTKEQIINATVLVLVLSLAVGIYLGAFDFIFEKLKVLLENFDLDKVKGLKR